jgi:aspartyl-tRNA(Asn)/glutamyl-tRNA(Gln) amidotransferase subunit A
VADLLSMSVAEVGAAYRQRTLSPVELVTACLERIEDTDGVIGAFVDVAATTAMAQAKDAEEALRLDRDLGPLHGIPVGVKDLVDVSGTPTEAGSPLRKGRVADTDAEVIRRLRLGGAVFLGKTRTEQFAYGASTPGTANPWALETVPGGSSGGSAAAVSAGQCTLAIGTDTAGSIRIPAALCGVVGLKPTHGRVPRRGVVPLSWSFDNVGPIGRSVADVAAMFKAMSGSADASGRPVGSGGDASQGDDEDLAGVRVGVPTNHFFDDVDPEVEAAVRAVLGFLESRGASLVPVAIPRDDLYEAVLSAILLPEAAAYHAEHFPARADQFARQLQKALTIGSTVRAVDYIQAQRLRGLVQDDWSAMFETVDVVVAPTVPMPAAPRSQRFIEWQSGRSESVNSAYVRLCMAGNLTGFPAISLPCGLSGQGLPIGVQVLAGPHRDLGLLQLAAGLEADLGWAGRPTAV